MPLEKHPSKRLFTTVGFLLVLLIGFLPLYVMTDYGGGTIYWRASEAYLFVGASHTGYRTSGFGYLWAFIKAFLSVPTESSDDKGVSIVFHVTPSGVQRVVHEDPPEYTGISSPTPFEDTIYAYCPGAFLCKWDGQNFVRATPHESQRIGDWNGLVHDSMNGKVVNGWNVRTMGVAGPTRDQQFQISLSTGTRISVESRVSTSRDAHVLITLSQPNGQTETIYDFGAAPRLVSRSTYYFVFQRH